MRAWPLKAFAGGQVINDTVGLSQVVLIGDAATRTGRAYYRNDQTFEKGAGGALKGPGGEWRIGENFLTGPDGTKLPRAPGGISYWFAWENYLGNRSTLYGRAN